MLKFFTENLLEILFGLISAGLLAFCKHLWSKNKQLEIMQKEDQNRKTREMILDEIEPLIQELTTVHAEITKNKENLEDELSQFRTDSDLVHKCIYEDLNKIQQKNEKNFTLILNSYKFRLIQLCKTHLKDGYISEHDFEQISEMYKLYSGLGGNGQAQEYYDKVLKLEIV